jgi:hypothetical protein
MIRVACAIAALILSACAGSERDIITVNGPAEPGHCAPPTNCVVLEHLEHGRLRVYCDSDLEFIVTR